MAPKNKGKNGYYYFMLDLREEEAQRGNYIKTMEELQVFASPYWTNLSVEEKEVYNRKAKEEKQKLSADQETKYNSLGVSFATQDSITRELDEQEKIMKATIKSIAQSLSPEALIRKPFYLCHVNHYFVIKNSELDIYQPAEIALAEFTLEDGLRETRHFILSPGTKLPLGVKGEAQSWAEKTHGIRLQDKVGQQEIEREHDYVKVYSEIVNFLKRDASVGQGTSIVLPVIYTMPDNLNNNASLSAVKSTMSFLSGCARERRDLFRVYPLPELFFNLWKKFEREGELITVAILDNEIEKDIFSCAPDLACDYHEQKDLSLYCSLSVVKRWVFTICDNVNLRAGIPTIPGHHAPKNADLEWIETASRRQLNGSENASYVDPPPQRAPPKFKNDLSKMQQLRIRQKEAEDEQVSQAERMKPPASVFRGAPLPPSVNDGDFPPLGGMGGGRGLLFKTGTGTGNWPISGRGRRK